MSTHGTTGAGLLAGAGSLGDAGSLGGAKIDLARQALAAAETAVGVAGQVTQPSKERALPAPPALESVLPDGLRQGSVVQVHGSTSVLLAMAQAAAGADRWCAMVGMSDLGWGAVASFLSLERVIAVPGPVPDIAAVLGALVDGFDVLVVGKCPGLSAADRRTISSRLRQRGAVLLTADHWPGAQMAMSVTTESWNGLGRGYGVLSGQRMLVTCTGRGQWAGPVRHTHVLCGREGLHEVQRVAPPVMPDHLTFAQVG